MLSIAPPRIEAAASGLSPAQLREAPAEGEWSINDVLAHLRACADVWGGCIRRLLDEDHPTIRAMDPRTWMQQTDYPDLEFQPSFDTYTRQRAELLDTVSSLTPQQWLRDATVTGAGKPLIYTIKHYADRIVVHERAHLKQIERTSETIRNR